MSYRDSVSSTLYFAAGGMLYLTSVTPFSPEIPHTIWELLTRVTFSYLYPGMWYLLGYFLLGLLMALRRTAAAFVLASIFCIVLVPSWWFSHLDQPLVLVCATCTESGGLAFYGYSHALVFVAATVQVGRLKKAEDPGHGDRGPEHTSNTSSPP